MIIDDVIAKITEQQQGKQYTSVWGCGEQLKDICRENEEYAELVLKDLENPEMSIEKCEQKIKARSDELHEQTKGNCICVSPAEADKIIRDFYGIGAHIEQKADNTINLFDFLG